jgi:hypothetical protein
MLPRVRNRNGITTTAAIISVAAVSLCALMLTKRGGSVFKPVEELRVRFTSSTEIPEPTKIISTGDWYYLDHLSSGLAYYESGKKTFLPMLAESWSELPDGTHSFKIRRDIKFHDGTPITAKDIEWSIKRHLIKKTSTHFPIWEYLVGCEDVRSLNDECPGLKIVGDQEIVFRLKSQTDSFFLQLASPETGIWAASDMDPITATLKPTKFSGPYYLETRTEESALLKRNPNSILSQQFPNSPKAIRLQIIPLGKLDASVLQNEVDVVLKFRKALGEREWKKDDIGVHTSSKATIIYLFGLGTGKRPPVGRDFISALWRQQHDTDLASADTFLPFTQKHGLTSNEFLGELPEKTNPKLRILCPDGFFAEAFLNLLKDTARTVGSEIDFHFASAAEFFSTFNDPKATEKFDYILSIYAASERYPAVQLRYLTKGLAKPPVDLKDAESPDKNIDRAAIFKNYERWMLSSRQAIPLFFDSTLLLSRPNIDLGEQSTSDAEIELWRVQERIN